MQLLPYQIQLLPNANVACNSLVPHLMLTIGVDSQYGYSLTTDYVTRGASPIGSDLSYMSTYYLADVLANYDAVASLPNLLFLPPSPSFSARLLRSPVYTSVTGLSAEDVDRFAKAHVQRWVEWVQTAQQIEPRLRGAVNMRDDKLREFAFKAAVAEHSFLLGDQDFGYKVAMAATGPTAEAYVGGGS